MPSTTRDAVSKMVLSGFASAFAGHLGNPSFYDIECATLEWVDWHNRKRLLGPIGLIPPAEQELNYYREIEPRPAVVGLNSTGLRNARGDSMNVHEHLQVFDTLRDLEVPFGGHLTHPWNRADVELTREFTLDVCETVERIHGGTDLMGVFVETAEQFGGWDNKYLLFDRLFDVIKDRATAEIEQRWLDRPTGVDVSSEIHDRTALIYVLRDDRGEQR